MEQVLIVQDDGMRKGWLKSRTDQKDCNINKWSIFNNEFFFRVRVCSTCREEGMGRRGDEMKRKILEIAFS